jgi:hypothetical protein
VTRPGDSVAAVQALLQDGETASLPLDALPAGLRLGLWFRTADRLRCVATAGLARLAARLPSRDEAAAAVFACEERHRSAWWPLVAARLKDAGRRRDLPELCVAIDQVGPASAALRTLLPRAALKPTGFAELETLLFGAPADQAVTAPRLLRALGATAELVEGGRGAPAAVVTDIDPLDPRNNWVRGRLLREPSAHELPRPGASAVLPGGWRALSSAEVPAGDPPRNAAIRWVLNRPWALLLAQVVFTQEAWAAERLEGGLALELDDAQLARFHEPGMVHVVVTTAAGDEVLCGSLGGLLLRVLDYLGVTLLAPAARPEFLDDRLGALVHALLERKVWRYDARGASGRRPGYLIHEEFSDACYGRFGGNHFYRLGSPLTAAVRSACEAWARERLDRARPSVRAPEEVTA